MKNKLSDLNNMLFLQMERVMDEELTDKQRAVEMERAKALNGLAGNVINNAKVAIEGMKLLYSGEVPKEELKKLIGGSKED